MIEELFHVGVRVPDLDDAMAELGKSMDLTWAAPQERQQALWTPETGPVTVALRFTYSCEGPTHLELLDGEPGSFWDGRVQPGAHHVGVWVDDVAGETQQRLDAGWRLVGASKSPEEGFGLFTYIAPPAGLVVELVSRLAKPMFDRWWAGAPALA